MKTVIATFLVVLSIHLGAGALVVCPCPNVDESCAPENIYTSTFNIDANTECECKFCNEPTPDVESKRAFYDECDTLAPLNCLSLNEHICVHGVVETYQVVTKDDGSKINCPACSQCAIDRKRSAGCPRHPCPLVNDDICELGVKNNFYTTEEGAFCQGCDTCITEDECPRLPCPLVNNDDCRFGVKSNNKYVADGNVCKGCDTCATLEECPPLPCPNMDQHMCTFGVKSDFYSSEEGLTCRSCNICATLEDCPRLPCPLVNDDICSRGVKPTFYINEDGAECKGCNACATEEDCPDQDCPSVDHCQHGVLQTYYNNGTTRCHGCDQCYKA